MPTPSRSGRGDDAPIRPSSIAKRRAVLDAAEEVFLRTGYLGTNMDEVATLSQVSKQTIYKHFGSKETLFVELVTAMTDGASDQVHEGAPADVAPDGLAAHLEEYAIRQLRVVMTPRLLQLRRLVIGEVARFPELARALYERGPQRAMSALGELFAHFDEEGLLRIDDVEVAASQFNWLIMSGPMNEAMLLGDDAIPDDDRLRAHAAQGVQVFLAAYRPR